MSEEGTFNRLCSKISEVINILRESECKLPDDTYLDHMVAGISGELLEYQDPDRRLEFWNSSGCSIFVQSFAAEKEGCQQFILLLLNFYLYYDLKHSNTRYLYKRHNTIFMISTLLHTVTDILGNRH